ncbi:MAG: sigma 54-interacting transcriptional regulator [Desulfitobacteriaceae bacterium]
MKEIVLIAPYTELAELGRQVAAEMDLEIEVREGLLEEAVGTAKEAEAQGCQVIISRGATAQRLETEVNIPIVGIRFTGYDVLRALSEARSAGSDVALIVFRDMVYDTSFLAELLGARIKEYVLKSEREVTDLVTRVAAEGATALIGGASAVKAGNQLGIPSFLIKSGKEAIWQALLEAKKVASVRQQERERTEKLKAMLDFIYEGIVGTSSEGLITTLNPAAERILGVSFESIWKKPASLVLPELKINTLLAEGEREIGALVKIRDRQIVANKIPLKVNTKNIGALVTFQEVNKLQVIEQNIRQKLHLRGHVAGYRFENIIGNSETIKHTVQIAQEFARVDSSVLILGETGVGKEMFAQSIHNASRRYAGPFVAINCAVLPENLLESELFGYAEGAFTGARKEGKAGLFELAHGGTIFLDELGEMSPSLQSRLLRVLEEKVVMRLGGERVNPVDVRVIAATNKDLREMMSRGAFREDLFYRLDVLRLRLPPLRKHKEDISQLVDHYLTKVSRRCQKERPKVSREGVALLQDYDWPGNIRELENVVERLVVLSRSNLLADDEVKTVLAGDDLLSELEERTVQDKNTRPGSLSLLEKEAIQQALKDSGHSYTKAAQILGIDRSTLWRKLKKMG